jgi:hypothetical protein
MLSRHCAISGSFNPFVAWGDELRGSRSRTGTGQESAPTHSAA